MGGPFLDEVTLDVSGGGGGRGAVSFRREKFVPNGGPDGGDGGRGASVVLEADDGLATLSGFRDRRRFHAPAGGAGTHALRHGADAGDLVLRVPVGTVATDVESGELLADLVTPGQRVVLAAGGRGGRGNARFATSTRQAPRIGELGAPGERRRVHLELRLIADVGLVGLPNAGKSTLLAALTGASPKIADYPFTTLTPNLGVAEDPGGRAVVIADVPGLIEGAADGAGLGHDFLRHLERTRLLLHVVDASAGPAAAVAALDTVRGELGSFSATLAGKPAIVVAAKVDLPGAVEAAAALRDAIPGAMAVSAVTGEGLDELLATAGERVLAERAPAAAAVAVAAAAGTVHRVYRHRPRTAAAAGVAISREGVAWRVSGEALERAIAMTDMDSAEAVLALQRRLRRLGVDAALAGAGVRAGDTVRIGATEFEWVPDALP
ncbi:MAG TPA: GTPase ObgE [Candidatus Dormibacteraeota bacterium]|nr:GTPase ObgE [Candidatus Dormibacteraeota bacterium]